MQNLQVAFDTKLFTRTASRFALKRNAFPPEAVEALAGDVLRRLSCGLTRHSNTDIPIISDASLTAFCDALIAPGPEAAMDFIEARRAEGVTRMGVYLGYVVAGARRLGEGWDRDVLSFTQVTTGTGHLYALMRALRAEIPNDTVTLHNRRTALFATVPGEDHGIGITVAADVFRERGWEIDLQVGCTHDSLITHAERTMPRIIGFSLSTEARFDALARVVVAVRLVAPQAIIGVACGEGVDAGKIDEVVDIDLLFDGAVAACADLEGLIRKAG